MDYYDKFIFLQKELNEDKNTWNFDKMGVQVERMSFVSRDQSILPGNGSFFCEKHQIELSNETCLPPTVLGYEKEVPEIFLEDSNIESNVNFHYYLFTPEDQICEDVIFMFHGLNERKWDKYFPWASELVNRTGKAVILFPLAFHMNRAPDSWSSKANMFLVSNLRTEKRPANSFSSFLNAAISTRLEAVPQRLFWSGLQTFMDFVRLVAKIKNGQHKGIKEGANVDMFGYSIGAFFAIIALMANPKNYFSNSKLACFCGGCTLDRMNPVSKYIMDSKSFLSLQSFFIEQLNCNFNEEQRLRHYFFDDHQSEPYFTRFLSYQHYKEDRERRLKELEKQIMAITLKKDEIIAPVEVINTLNGDYRDINIPVDILDFDYTYNHVQPFRATPRNREEVNAAFEQVFAKTANFYA
ncbi:MAG: DUF6051 family protein [Flavobacteriales bacterium]|nr:DUF6051 family protein [Flavobacteriales bacterium]